MLLYRDGFIELNYDAATDILTVSWPDITDLQDFGLQHAFSKLVETIRYYDIKKLLIDSRFNKVYIQEQDYTDLIKRFHQSLGSTRLEMAARLGSLDLSREEKASRHAAQLIDLIKPVFAFQNFRHANDALNWLRAG